MGPGASTTQLDDCTPAKERLQQLSPKKEVVGLQVGKFVDTSYDEFQKGITPSGRNQSLNMVIFYRPTL
jgi:hypothetical protein